MNKKRTIPILAVALALVCAVGFKSYRGAQAPRRSGATRVALVRPKAVLARNLAEEARRIAPSKANLPRIIETYRQSLDNHDDAFVKRDLAKALIQNGQIDEARPLMREFLAKLKSGQIGYASNDPGFALGVSEDAARVGLTGDAGAIVAGFAQGPIHQIDARFTYPELDRVPAHARANGLFAAGVGKLRVHDNRGAARLFEEVARLRPDWKWGHFMRAYALAFAGDRKAADAGFAKASRMGLRRPEGI